MEKIEDYINYSFVESALRADRSSLKQKDHHPSASSGQAPAQRHKETRRRNFKYKRLFDELFRSD